MLFDPLFELSHILCGQKMRMYSLFLVMAGESGLLVAKPERCTASHKLTPEQWSQSLSL